jgi:hypothetical protein
VRVTVAMAVFETAVRVDVEGEVEWVALEVAAGVGAEVEVVWVGVDMTCCILFLFVRF